MTVGKKGNTGEEGQGDRQDLLRKMFSVSTLHPLGLSLLLHFAQHWCGVNVIIFKEMFSSNQLTRYLSSFYYIISTSKLDIDLNLLPLPDRECVRDSGEQCRPLHLHLHCRIGPAGRHRQ